MARQPLLLDQEDAPLAANFRDTSPTRQRAFYCSNFIGIFKACFPQLQLVSLSRIELVGYISGALFTLGWWLFIDGVSYASSRIPPLEVAVGFEDFVPGILSTFSLIIVNLINKETLGADDFSFSGTNVATKARACAFIGVTMALSAIIGALSIMCVKYVVPGFSGDTLYFGIMIPLQNILIFAGSMVLWFGRNGENADQYGF